MESDASPSIVSFVIRFVMAETPPAEEAQPSYRGAIRHIQSNEELVFNVWEDAVDFIERYVPLKGDSNEQDAARSNHIESGESTCA
ncbi:MAG: hypothetical protein ACOYZ8_07505 [Chloroflexota bacterium]